VYTMAMTVDVSYVMSMTTWGTVMSKLDKCTLCILTSCVFSQLILLIFSQFYVVNSIVLCLFFSSLCYNHHRVMLETSLCTFISFTVSQVYALNNTVLCIFVHKFMLYTSTCYAINISLYNHNSTYLNNAYDTFHLRL
jgi:hypothetical protein